MWPHEEKIREAGPTRGWPPNQGASPRLTHFRRGGVLLRLRSGGPQSVARSVSVERRLSVGLFRRITERARESHFGVSFHERVPSRTVRANPRGTPFPQTRSCSCPWPQAAGRSRPGAGLTAGGAGCRRQHCSDAGAEEPSALRPRRRFSSKWKRLTNRLDVW